MEIKEELIKLIIENANSIPSYIKSEQVFESKLLDDLNYDSVDIVSLIVAIEEKWGIELTDTNLLASKINDVKMLYELVKSMIEEKESR